MDLESSGGEVHDAIRAFELDIARMKGKNPIETKCNDNMDIGRTILILGMDSAIAVGRERQSRLELQWTLNARPKRLDI